MHYRVVLVTPRGDMWGYNELHGKYPAEHLPVWGNQQMGDNTTVINLIIVTTITAIIVFTVLPIGTTGLGTITDSQRLWVRETLCN